MGAVRILGVFDNLSRLGGIDAKEVKGVMQLCGKSCLLGKKVPTIRTIASNLKSFVSLSRCFWVNSQAPI
jgi:hypothetical protein